MSLISFHATIETEYAKESVHWKKAEVKRNDARSKDEGTKKNKNYDSFEAFFFFHQNVA